MARLYFKEKSGKFQRTAKMLGALYVETEKDEAIFVMPGKWKKLKNENEHVKPAIRWKEGSGIDMGQLRKDCDNYEEKTNIWYDTATLRWLIETIKKIQPHLTK